MDSFTFLLQSKMKVVLKHSPEFRSNFAHVQLSPISISQGTNKRRQNFRPRETRQLCLNIEKHYFRRTVMSSEMSDSKIQEKGENVRKWRASLLWQRIEDKVRIINHTSSLIFTPRFCGQNAFLSEILFHWYFFYVFLEMLKTVQKKSSPSLKFRAATHFGDKTVDGWCHKERCTGTKEVMRTWARRRRRREKGLCRHALLCDDILMTLRI